MRIKLGPHFPALAPAQSPAFGPKTEQEEQDKTSDGHAGHNFGLGFAHGLRTVRRSDHN